MPHPCHARIIPTLGPAGADRPTIEALVHAGADVFRLNFSHGTCGQLAERGSAGGPHHLGCVGASSVAPEPGMHS